MDSQPRVNFDGFCAFYSIEEQTIASWVVTTQNGDYRDRLDPNLEAPYKIGRQGEERGGGRLTHTPLQAGKEPCYYSVVITKP